MTTKYESPDMKRLDRAIRAKADAGLASWRKLAVDLGPAARELVHQYETAARQLETIGNSTASRVRQLRTDDLVLDAGRQRLIRETLDAARKERDAARQRMAAARTILEREIRALALPKLDPKREMAARDELRLLADSGRDPASLLVELAQRDDELAAVAVSSYGESLLRAKGVRDAPKVHKDVIDIAVQSARKSSDPKRQRGAAAYAQLSELDATTACLESIGRDELARENLDHELR